MDKVILNTNTASGKKSEAMDSDEIDKLLKYGAYHLFEKEEGEEKTSLADENIDDILEKKTYVLDHGNDENKEENEERTPSLFSKANFAIEGFFFFLFIFFLFFIYFFNLIISKGTNTIDLNDKDFWDKVLVHAHTTHSLLKLLKSNNDFDPEKFMDDFFMISKHIVEDHKSKNLDTKIELQMSDFLSIIELIEGNEKFTKKQRSRAEEIYSGMFSRNRRIRKTILSESKIEPKKLKTKKQLKLERADKRLIDTLYKSIMNFGPYRPEIILEALEDKIGIPRDLTKEKILSLTENCYYYLFKESTFVKSKEPNMKIESRKNNLNVKFDLSMKTFLDQTITLQYLSVCDNIVSIWYPVDCITISYKEEKFKPAKEIEITLVANDVQIPEEKEDFLYLAFCYEEKKNIVRFEKVSSPFKDPSKTVKKSVVVPGFVGSYTVQLVVFNKLGIQVISNCETKFHVKKEKNLKESNFKELNLKSSGNFIDCFNVIGALLLMKEFEPQVTNNTFLPDWWNSSYDKFIAKKVLKHGFIGYQGNIQALVKKMHLKENPNAEFEAPKIAVINKRIKFVVLNHYKTIKKKDYSVKILHSANNCDLFHQKCLKESKPGDLKSFYLFSGKDENGNVVKKLKLPKPVKKKTNFFNLLEAVEEIIDVNPEKVPPRKTPVKIKYASKDNRKRKRTSKNKENNNAMQSNEDEDNSQTEEELIEEYPQQSLPMKRINNNNPSSESHALNNFIQNFNQNRQHVFTPSQMVQQQKSPGYIPQKQPFNMVNPQKRPINHPTNQNHSIFNPPPNSHLGPVNYQSPVNSFYKSVPNHLLPLSSNHPNNSPYHPPSIMKISPLKSNVVPSKPPNNVFPPITPQKQFKKEIVSPLKQNNSLAKNQVQNNASPLKNVSQQQQPFSSPVNNYVQPVYVQQVPPNYFPQQQFYPQQGYYTPPRQYPPPSSNHFFPSHPPQFYQQPSSQPKHYFVPTQLQSPLNPNQNHPNQPHPSPKQIPPQHNQQNQQNQPSNQPHPHQNHPNQPHPYPNQIPPQQNQQNQPSNQPHPHQTHPNQSQQFQTNQNQIHPSPKQIPPQFQPNQPNQHNQHNQQILQPQSSPKKPSIQLAPIKTLLTQPQQVPPQQTEQKQNDSENN